MFSSVMRHKFVIDATLRPTASPGSSWFFPAHHGTTVNQPAVDMLHWAEHRAFYPSRSLSLRSQAAPKPIGLLAGRAAESSSSGSSLAPLLRLRLLFRPLLAPSTVSTTTTRIARVISLHLIIPGNSRLLWKGVSQFPALKGTDERSVARGRRFKYKPEPRLRDTEGR